MKSIEQQIVEWNREIFPNANRKAFYEKLEEELREALDCMILDNPEDDLVMEIADIAIVAISWLNRYEDMTLTEAIEEKFEIIKRRKYGLEDENGGRFKI